MEVTENEMLPLYDEMKKFDFKIPFSVMTEQFDDNNEVYSTQGDTDNRNKRKEKKTIYYHDENTHTMSNKENVSRNDNCNVVQTENDITGFNKTQECTGLSTPTWISDLLYNNNNIKDPYCSSRTQTDTNPLTSSVSGDLLHRDRNYKNSVNWPTKSTDSVSSYNRNVSCCNSYYTRNQLNNKLKFLSTNLINILRAYSYYAAVVKKSVPVAMKLDEKIKYLKARDYYFQSSREIVEQVILPQINNIYFIRAFINRTKMLGTRTNFNCTINDVEGVYKDLIAWVFHMRRETGLKAKQNPQTQMSGNIEFTETSLLLNRNISNNADQSQNSTSVCLLSYGSPGNELSININTEILNSINRQNALINLRENNNVHMNNKQCNLEQETRFNQTIDVSSDRGNSLTCETLHHDAVTVIQNPTRCASTDSGFISPRTEQNNTEQIIEDPYITHVTSLNPNATYILPGNCTVCGAITSKKCLGCFNIYYCSSGCQSIHWIRHKADCTLNSTQL